MKNAPLMRSDTEIVQQVVQGDVNAFEHLLTRHRDYVLGIVKRHVPYQEAEETAQEVFIRAYKSLLTFKGKSKFKYWLSSIAVRTCSDYWRKAYRSREVPLSSLSENHRNWLENALSDHSDQTYQEAGSQQEAKELLAWALGKLSPKDRMVLEMVYLNGLSGKEAAEMSGWSISNVKVRSYRARNKLKKILEEVLET